MHLGKINNEFFFLVEKGGHLEIERVCREDVATFSSIWNRFFEVFRPDLSGQVLMGFNQCRWTARETCGLSVFMKF